MRFAAILACSAGAALGGCSTLPTAGPTTGQVVDQSVKDDQTRFDIVDVDDNVVSTLLARSGESFRTRFRKYGKPPDPKIGIGDTITVTTNEMLVSLNAGERFVLAIVPVGENGLAHQPVYLRRPFDRAPDPDACATIFKLDTLMPRGTQPC